MYGTRQRSQQATVTVRAIRTDTGDIIATGMGQGAFPHIDDVVGGTKAIQKACEKLSGDLITRILDRWQDDVSAGTSLTLKVRNVADFSQLSALKSALPVHVRGLSNVVQREFHGGLATLELTMTGNADDLAQRLSGKVIANMRVKVTGMTQNSVTIELLPIEE